MKGPVEYETVQTYGGMYDKKTRLYNKKEHKKSSGSKRGSVKGLRRT